ncbi:DUF983 domain-containing protein [Sphingomonas sp. BIUV-7]|uniref:DUF983 domain-containing protein n=1 Tax=Sphingomonas natans TaxID=3063330 RepID=A0ABT8YEM8_9SPHN|nr:DUF983 domain-containing protein [Sphingomonas sp. BIUV-7]MDO6416826.1 DUF983 domain-containing protein [Sphingomonas sp. BIUV-7]
MPRLSFGEGITRGLKRHCPHCDSPTLFQGYLKVRPICPVCSADNGQHRVDDIASYVTVLLVAHVLIAPALAVPWFWGLPLWAALTILLSAMTAATLAALPFIKGGVIGALTVTSQPAV